LVPLLIVPVCFAIALHLAIKPADRPMLGFLSVLSCIWMGASLSLTSIVNERDVFDHERLLFLRIGSYVAAKTFVLGVLSALETVVFFTSFSILRDVRGSEPALFGGAWPMFVLALVGLAATGMGLVISAAARRNKPLPNFILPLLMIVQMLFSVQVAGDGNATLHRAYGEFNGHTCRVSAAHAVRRRAERWLAAQAEGEPGAVEPGWYCSDCENRRIAGTKKQLPESDTRQNQLRPNLAAAIGSYLTISRYGDIALRSFAYFSDDDHAFRGGTDLAATRGKTATTRFGYARWRREALAVLAIFIAGLPALTARILSRQ
jgi:hypothetical protein